MTTETKETTKLNREMEQDKRYLSFQRDRESFEICPLESDPGEERFRVDNLITNGVYIVEQEGKRLVCSCPDFQNRCSDLNIRCKHILAVENWKARKEQGGMKEHNFNPQKYLIKIKGKDYLEVKFRLHWFRLEKAAWDIKTDLVKLDMDKGIALVRADIFDEKGQHKSSGLKMEYQKNFFDYVEKASTGAIGRALAGLGYGTLQTFDLDEGIEKGRIVDAPVSLCGNGNGNGEGNGKIQVELKPLDNTKGLNGNGRNGNNGAPKASMRQVRYIKDLHKDMGVEPKINVAALSRDQASELIERLQRELINRRNKN